MENYRWPCGLAFSLSLITHLAMACPAGSDNAFTLRRLQVCPGDQRAEDIQSTIPVSYSVGCSGQYAGSNISWQFDMRLLATRESTGAFADGDVSVNGLGAGPGPDSEATVWVRAERITDTVPETYVPIIYRYALSASSTGTSDGAWSVASASVGGGVQGFSVTACTHRPNTQRPNCDEGGHQNEERSGLGTGFIGPGAEVPVSASIYMSSASGLNQEPASRGTAEAQATAQISVEIDSTFLYQDGYRLVFSDNNCLHSGAFE